MKDHLSWTLTAIGVLAFTLALYQVNQYMVQQATIQPSLDQLEQLGDSGLGGVDVEQTRKLIEASSQALIQSIVLDVILALVFLAGGFWLTPKAHAHHNGQ